MKTERFIYNLNYPIYEKESCEIEVRALFQCDLKEKVFFESRKVHPSISPFLKSRLEIIYRTSTFLELIELIAKDKITASDFMVKYMELGIADPHFKKRRAYCKAIGLVIEGLACYTSPKILFGITFCQGNWYFGKLTEKSINWKKHNQKPNSYSSSIGLSTAKVLINIAGNGDTSKRLIDPCCGVGTVLLEGLWAGYDIIGCEINSKTAENARKNLRYFNYEAKVITGDIQDIDDRFDASIVDLPYGNFSLKNDENQLKIIRNAIRISKKIVLASSEDIRAELARENLKIIDHCRIGKNNNGNFLRYIWVCEVG
ncbi:TRM11 family SAM-dependent methyltransferase [Acetobacterium carbinolicum]|uniref:TRM11 family SAM-dependent methyltransferase n=1 Tax=Acetobacterium carbinolicum TaxID=52690 RepID=UPI0039C994A3